MKSEVTEATMEKIDYKQKLKHLYQPSAKEAVEVNAPPMNFLMIDGRGDPNTSKAFAEAVEALFAVSYTLKFMIKKGSSAIDYGVGFRSRGSGGPTTCPSSRRQTRRIGNGRR